MFYSIFLFDYVNFRLEAQPYVQLADEGNYSAVNAKAKEIASQINAETWILEDLGTTLRGFFTSSNIPISQTTGFSFLVMLTQFLKPIPFSAPGLGNVAYTAGQVGWSEHDTKLLSRGIATTTLLKPNLVLDKLERPPADDPRWHDASYYWWWLRPENAFYIGWWDLDSIEAMHRKLIEVAPNFAVVDVMDFKLHPSVTHQSLLNDYEQAIALFETAQKEQLGLFQIIS
jgi:hypothetical protein